MLDDHLFKLDIIDGVQLLYGRYHEKFKGWKAGQAWLVKRKHPRGLNGGLHRMELPETPIHNGV